jgi:hypothetical protein
VVVVVTDVSVEREEVEEVDEEGAVVGGEVDVDDWASVVREDKDAEGEVEVVVEEVEDVESGEVVDIDEEVVVVVNRSGEEVTVVGGAEVEGKIVSTSVEVMTMIEVSVLRIARGGFSDWLSRYQLVL